MFGHKFKTEKQKERGKLLRFVCFCLAFVLVFGSASAAVYLKNSGFSLTEYFKNKENRENTGDESVPQEVRNPQGRLNLLFYCSSSDKEELYFLYEVVADMDNCVWKIFPLDSSDPKFSSALKNGGESSLARAVEKKLNIKTDGYLASTAETFPVAVNYMDGLEYLIEKRVEYKTGDYSLILPAGVTRITGDDLLYYMKYCRTIGTRGLKIQGELMRAMLESYINEENLENGTIIFQKLLDKTGSDSDISLIEATGYLEELKLYYSAENKREPVIIIG